MGMKKDTILMQGKNSETSINAPWGKLTGVRPVKIARTLLQSGATDQEVIRMFEQEIGADSKRSALAVSIAKLERSLIEQAYDDGISIYVGIPFCPSRCAYCSFVSFSVDKCEQLLEPYMDCLLKEITASAELVKNMKRRVETVYIGGGTPTTLPPKQLERLLRALQESFDLSALKEFSVEAGRPDTITEEKLQVLKRYGVTRISLNPQSMNQSVLDKIGRRHSPQDILSAYSLARRLDFQHINMDVIAGLPEENYESFCNTLQILTSLDPESITVHTMSLKRASELNQNTSRYQITAGEVVGQMICFASECLDDVGYIPYYLYRQKNILGGYENTGYAKPGRACLYNVYIMEEVQSILSLGAGGSTKIILPNDIERIFNVKEPTEYIRRIDEMIERKQKIYSLIQ